MNIENQQLTLLLMGIPVILLFVWTLLQQFSISRIKKNQKILFGDSENRNLEQILLDTKKKITGTEAQIKDLYEITGKIHSLSHLGLHKMGVVRFNPFRDIGGDQSFSVALLDGNDNGIVISSLYSREGVRVYAKQLKNGISEQHQLTEEEKHAISIATEQKASVKNKKRL